MNFLTIIIPVFNQEELVIRALQSIPKRKDIKIIVVDDCSTDNTYKNILKWREDNSNNFCDISVIKNDKNYGVGTSMNIAYKLADSKYLYVIDSDDYLLTDKFNDLLNNINKYSEYDIIRIRDELNDMSIDKKPHTAGWSYILRNRFSIDYPKLRKQGDWEYWKLLINKDATCVNTGIVCYHYNYPREGSIMWNFDHGITDWKGDIINA